jgi:hypothetical protein
MAGRTKGKIALAIVCCCGFAFAALLFFYAVGPWIDRKAIPMFGSRLSDAMVFGAAANQCICNHTPSSGSALGLVDFIRTQCTDAGIGSFSSLLLAARSNRFRAFGEWVWARHVDHSDDTDRYLQCFTRAPLCETKVCAFIVIAKSL